jgi:hypothetical protein
MFDDVFRMTTICTENFRDGVHDSFGDSIIAGALEPILKEIDSLRYHSEEFNRQAVEIDRILEEARSIHLNEQ